MDKKFHPPKRRIILIAFSIFIICLLLGLGLYSAYKRPPMTTIDDTVTPLSSTAQIKEQLETMSVTLDSMSSIIDTNQSEVENIKTTINETSETLNYSFTSVNEDIDTVLNQMTTDLSDLSKQVETTKTDINTLITEINEGQNAEIMTKFEAILAKLNDISGQIDEMSKANKDSYEKIIAKLNNFQTELNKYLETSNEELAETIKTNFSEMTTKVDTTLTTLTANLNSISTTVSTSTETITALIESTKSNNPEYLNEQFTALSTDIDTVNSSIVNLSETTATQHSEVTEQINNFTTAVNDHLDEFEGLLDEKLTVEFRTVNDNISNSVSTLETDISNLSTEISTAKTEITDLINQIEEDNADDLPNKIEDIQTHLDTITTHFDGTLASISTLISDLSTQNATEYSNTIDKLTSIQTDLTEVSNTSKTDLQNKLDTMKTEYEQSISELQTSVDESFSDLSTTISNGNASINEKLDSVNTQITESVNTSINNQTSTINGKFDDVNSSLSTQSQNIENDFNSISNQLTTNYNNLSQQEQENKDEIAALITQYQQSVDSYNTNAEQSFQNVVKIKSDIASALNDKGSVRADGQRWDGTETWDELADGIVNLELDIHIPVDPKYCVLERQVRNRIEPTCEEDGGYNDVQYCLTCEADATNVWVVIPKTGHNLSTVVIPPTCTEQGCTRHYCTNIDPNTGIPCDYYYDDNIVPALGHDPREFVNEPVSLPTCTLTGIHNEVVYCDRCNAKLSSTQRVTPALGHEYDSVVVAPTCTEQGYTTHTCTRCGDKLANTDYTTALGHNEVYAGQANAHTWCSRCHQVFSTNHTYTATVKTNSTCTVKGTHTYTCACGYHYDSQDIPLAEHTYNQTAKVYLQQPSIQIYLSCYAGDARGPSGAGYWHYGNTGSGTAVSINGQGTWYTEGNAMIFLGGWAGSPAWITSHRLPGTTDTYMNEVAGLTNVNAGTGINGTFRLYQVHDKCGVCGHVK